MMRRILRRVPPEDIEGRRSGGVDCTTLARAGEIVRDVQHGGPDSLRAHAERLGDLAPGEPLVLDREVLEAALGLLPQRERNLLERTKERVRDFAEAQRRSLADLTLEVPGGQAGHTVAAMDRAGCYVPGGRYSLPSSVIMTVVPARVAGVKEVIVASPRPTQVTLAAAAMCGADAVLAVGGAQAIAALAYGGGVIEPCDVIVGPGNRWVTAAKQLVAGSVAIDMLAGPSELVVLADVTANPSLVAADLLAQAEHDPDASPILVTVDAALIPEVEAELARQLTDLPTAEIATAALDNGCTVAAGTAQVAAEICDRLAPEHLALHVDQPASWEANLRHYGTLFIGEQAAEVFGDYGIGPNHVLPTGGAARTTGGLSVFTFLRVRTWLRLDRDGLPASMLDDTAEMARLESLEAHARSAEARRGHPPGSPPRGS